MKTFLLILACFITLNVAAQKSLNVYDISQKQLKLMNVSQKQDSISRSKIFLDSLYSPYQVFWNGYLGDADVVSTWMNKNMNKLSAWQTKNKAIDGKKLQKQLDSVAKDMKKLTGYEAKGNWYIAYGPAWTDLGGLGDFAMVIDLAHSSNATNERIKRMFPHELTHQIMTNVNTHKDTTALSSIIGEGFAVWMSQKYWKQKYTVAQNLGYSNEELQQCDQHLDKLKGFLTKYHNSVDQNIIDVFRNRGAKLNDKLPGAIGYYLGYKIVESYVSKNGSNSWKDIFKKPAKEIYEKSGFQASLI